MAKLTPAQRECLEIMAKNDGSMRAAASYKPTKILVRLGLARPKPSMSLTSYTRLFEITDAGRAVLAERKP